MLIPDLTTERLLIRRFTMADLPALHRILDLELNWGGHPRPIEERGEILQLNLAGYELDAPCGWRAIEGRADGQLLGQVRLNVDHVSREVRALFHPAREDGRDGFTTLEYHLGYALAPAHQGQGYAFEAAQALVRYAFEELRLARLWAETSEGNTRSQDLLRRLGFRLESAPRPGWPDRVVAMLPNPEAPRPAALMPPPGTACEEPGAAPCDLHQRNRAAWNEAAARYEELVERDVAFLRAGGKNFCPPEIRYLADLSSWCRRAIHLQCAGGRDTLSLWNQGAAEVVGVDISDRMIGCARRKAEALGAPAQWYCCDLLDTPHELDGTADLVYTGRGALNWIMAIDPWAAVVARLLRPGGRLYLYEGHPLCWILDLEAADFRLDPVYGDYFSDRIDVNQGWPVQYLGDLGRPAEEFARKYERQWTLGQVMNALIAAGLRVERLEEHPDQYWEDFPNMRPAVSRRFPHTYSLLMRKE